MEDKENRSTYEEHDASFDPDPETTLSEDELQDSILASVALFWDSIGGADKEKGGFSFSLIIAVVIAMLIPNIVEKQGLRKIPKVRTTMAITLMVCIVVYFLYMGLTTGFNFRA